MNKSWYISPNEFVDYMIAMMTINGLDPDTKMHPQDVYDALAVAAQGLATGMLIAGSKISDDKKEKSAMMQAKDIKKG